MGQALYTKADNDGSPHCPYHAGHAIAWREDLPGDLKDLVVPPVSFDVARDYDMLADHTHGRDAANQPCFSEFRFVLTQLRSDDDEVFYEAPVYAESLTSWRLVDERWLVCRTTVDNLDPRETHTQLSISNTMPR
jgi:hypothetical protein